VPKVTGQNPKHQTWGSRAVVLLNRWCISDDFWGGDISFGSRHASRPQAFGENHSKHWGVVPNRDKLKRKQLPLALRLTLVTKGVSNRERESA
jgi:hypothetical protein